MPDLAKPTCVSKSYPSGLVVGDYTNLALCLLMDPDLPLI